MSIRKPNHTPADFLSQAMAEAARTMASAEAYGATARGKVERLLTLGREATKETPVPGASYADGAQCLFWLTEEDAVAIGAHENWQSSPFKDGDEAGLRLLTFAMLLKEALRRAGVDLEIDLDFLLRKEKEGTPTPEDFNAGCKALNRAIENAWAQFGAAVRDASKGAAGQMGGANTVTTPNAPQAATSASKDRKSAGKRVDAIRFLGGAWEIECDADRRGYEDNLGFHYLATLVKSPGKDWPAQTLQRSVVSRNSETKTVKDARRNKLDFGARYEERGDINAQDRQMDAVERGQIKARLEKLNQDRNELNRQYKEDEREDPAYHAQIQEIDDESSKLAAELRKTKTRRGKDRMMPTDARRAANAVREALRRTLNQIKEKQPKAYQSLHAGLRTGNNLRYTGQSWEVQT